MKTRILALLLATALLFALFPTASQAVQLSNTVASNEKSIPEDAVEFNGHWYKVVKDATITSWDAALEYCTSKNGYLATISSAEENAFLYSYITQEGYSSAYFGLTDTTAEGVWEWSNGEPVTYTNWHKGEPNSQNSKEDYAMFYYKFSDGTWNDGTFGGGTAFICEWGEPDAIPEFAIETFDGHNYQYFGEVLTWTAAKARCEELGGYLVTIGSEAEQEFVASMVESYSLKSIWLGASDAEKEGEWTWVTGEPFLWSNWATNEPNNDYNGTEDYVGMYYKYENQRNYTWNDFKINTGAIGGFICEWETDINSGVGTDIDPIIFIPGIMGSRLFTSDTVFDNSTLVWDPPRDAEGLWNIHKLNERLEYGNTLYVRPCENQNDMTSGTVAKYGKEYGAEGTYKDIVDKLCSEYPNRAVYVFSYDWRYSNAVSAQKLAEFIDTLNTDKVDLVAHSMGGLVASSYYQNHPEKVDKIITCGTPYEGAPKLLNAVQNWDVLAEGVVGSGDDWADNFLGIWGGMTKELKSSFDGVAELTPTKNYISKLPMWRDSIWPFSLGDDTLTYSDYVEICDAIFGNKKYSSAVNFQKSLLDSSGYNALLNYENAYFLIGVNKATISAVKFQYINEDIDEALYESDLEYDTKGDGTVPYLSASIMEQVEQLDHSRWKTKTATHKGVVKNSKCIEWVCDILSDGTSDIATDTLTNTSYTVVRAACPVEVQITDGTEVLCSDLEALAPSAEFGRLDLLGENNEIKMFCIDSADGYDIVLNGTDEGTLDYTIRFFDGDGNLYDERVFDDVPLTEDTIITTNADEGQDTVLEVDHNGDGVVDEIWRAGSGEGVTEDEMQRIPMTAITMTAEHQTISVGETSNVTVTAVPVNSNDILQCIYTSSDTTVAMVDENGVVTGLTAGTVTIEATTPNGLTAEVTIIVIDSGANCQHTNKTEYPYQSATCTEDGHNLYYICNSCNAVLKADGVTKTTIEAETIPADCPSAQFNDVPLGQWYHDPVDWAVEKGITNGMGGGVFGVNEACNRAQVVTFLWRAMGCPGPASGENPFPDVLSGKWYTDAVLWAVEEGITNGMGDGTFGVETECTRAQVVTFLWRTAGCPKPTATECAFSDVEQGRWYTDAVLWAVEQGITNGMGDGTFGVDLICTRAKVVTFLWRAFVK